MSEDLGFEIHVFVCTNQRPDKKNCFDSGGEDFRFALKERLKPYGVRVRVNKAGCLGYCSKGPVLVIHPDNKWYHSFDQSSLDEIENYIVEKLHANS